ncbi:MAG: folate family ECF transporter S component [Oscillospiraceae bacterium]|nr:folate family ECF transporter S component [Oscillospiraceae bacterium]
MKISTKKIAISAMLIAFDVIFTRVLALNMPLTKIGLGFAAVMVCGMLYGPGWAAVCAGLGDLVGSLLFPTGAYFPGFTVTAAIGGAILGAALYNRRLKLSGCILTAFVNGLVVSLILNTTMISLVFGPPLGPLFLTRLGQFGIMLCVQTLVLFFLERSDTLYNEIISLRD